MQVNVYTWAGCVNSYKDDTKIPYDNKGLSKGNYI